MKKVIRASSIAVQNSRGQWEVQNVPPEGLEVSRYHGIDLELQLESMYLMSAVAWLRICAHRAMTVRL